jgi:hypothetical protein
MPVMGSGRRNGECQRSYIMDDVAAAIAFSCDRLHFQVIMHAPPTFAMLDRDELGLLAKPGSTGQIGGVSVA